METRIFTGSIDRQTRTINADERGYLPVPVTRQNEMTTERTANVLLIDVSGSTEDRISFTDAKCKLIGEKVSSTLFVSNLPSSAYFSLISFSDRAKILHPMQMLKEKLTVIKAIQSCRSGGITAMQSAMMKAYDEFKKAPADYQKRFYCVSDGMANDGDCRDVADLLKGAGVQLHFIGFGEGSAIDEALMKELASVSETTGESLYRHFSSAQQFSRFMGCQSRTITN